MFSIPKDIEFILESLNKFGYEAYIVGGCVRDMIMGITPNDYDVTTSASPKKIIEIFDKTIPTGIKHGTITVLIGEYSVEVTTYRTDGEYKDHRRPEDVVFVKNLKDDLARRDFTVNAIAYNPKDGLKDYFGGIDDINKHLLRAVGEPERRFNEDALRILRLFRFSSVLGFTIDNTTAEAAVKSSYLLKQVSVERVYTELIKTLNGKKPEVLKALTDIKAFDFLGINNNPDYSKVAQLSKYNLSLFTFLYSSGANIINAYDILKIKNKDKNIANGLLKLLTFSFPINKAQIKEMLFLTNQDIFIKYIHFKHIYFNINTSKIKMLLNEIISNKEPYKISDLKISGNELIDLGFKGEKIGDILEELRKLVINNPNNNKCEFLLSKANEFNRN